MPDWQGESTCWAKPCPGRVLELAADIESLDEEAISYRGTATMDGTPIIRLQDCVGPMIPVVDLDDPDALRNRFALLSADRVCPRRLSRLAAPALPAVSEVNRPFQCGPPLRCLLPRPFSRTIFPDGRFFPGVLLMQACLELAAALAAEVPPPARGRVEIAVRFEHEAPRIHTSR